ncbi:hypothetical protein EDEG_02336 [Edhazardia aedis USNM 41457]|uniref:Uncharacterized protein n=1 Tax=Edhazardia aedis (strain USNM 41457) TaxID=1003232 RepID=J8ZUH4_EDHAE|nr:hypothetical protein EDEG_02336 [Edhazardia aedis USNM 41457]|eukprot:EJW03328.1 hypothetical protein EDEG_02336 [Edhazardia aedis USNM 41457]
MQSNDKRNEKKTNSALLNSFINNSVAKYDYYNGYYIGTNTTPKPEEIIVPGDKNALHGYVWKNLSKKVPCLHIKVFFSIFYKSFIDNYLHGLRILIKTKTDMPSSENNLQNYSEFNGKKIANRLGNFSLKNCNESEFDPESNSYTNSNTTTDSVEPSLEHIKKELFARLLSKLHNKDPIELIYQKQAYTEIDQPLKYDNKFNTNELSNIYNIHINDSISVIKEIKSLLSERKLTNTIFVVLNDSTFEDLKMQDAHNFVQITTNIYKSSNSTEREVVKNINELENITNIKNDLAIQDILNNEKYSVETVITFDKCIKSAYSFTDMNRIYMDHLLKKLRNFEVYAYLQNNIIYIIYSTALLKLNDNVYRYHSTLFNPKNCDFLLEKNQARFLVKYDQKPATTKEIFDTVHKIAQIYNPKYEVYLNINNSVQMLNNSFFETFSFSGIDFDHIQ